jgi:hypothetical protein
MVAFVLSVSLGSGKSAEQDDEGIPLSALAGKYSITRSGSVALCLNPTTFALSDCATKGALVSPQSLLVVGAFARDENGDSCATVTDVFSNLPVGISPPAVLVGLHFVDKITSYDPATGTGDSTLTAYSAGGQCNGSTLIPPGLRKLV